MALSFGSKSELKCAKILNKCGMPLIDGETVHFKIGLKEIDFRVKNVNILPDGTFIEYHPYDRDGRTNEKYYKERRKVLDENGYNDKLIVFKSLKEVEEMLSEKN